MTDWNTIIKGWIQRHHTGYDRTYTNRVPVGLLFFELRTATGYGRENPQSIDAFHVHDVPSKSYERTAYEIKVSGGDFEREIRQPGKRKLAMLFSNRFYFVTKPGVTSPAKVPVDCGLIEVSENGQAITVVKAPWRDTHPPTWALVASIARQAKK